MEETKKGNWGGKREGSGRPKTGIKRTCFQVSCQPEELEYIKAKAKEKGITTSSLVLQAIKNFE